MIASAKIDSCDIERYSWAESYRALRWTDCLCRLLVNNHQLGRGATAVHTTSLQFKSKAVIESVSLGLLNLVQQVFPADFAVLVLHRHIHLIKDAQIVEALLRVHHRALAERISIADLKFAVHHKWLGSLQA